MHKKFSYSNKMKPFKLGLSVLVLSSYLVSVSPLVGAAELETSSTSETVEMQNGANLLTNADFSRTKSKEGQWSGNQAEAWSLWIPSNITASNYSAEVNGEGQLVLGSEQEPFRAAVYQDLTVKGGERYKLSFDLKMENKVSFARVRVMEKQGNQQVNSFYTPNFSGTADWQTINHEFTLQPQTDNVRIELFYEQGTGMVWYDNIAVVQQESDTKPEKDSLEQSITIPGNAIYLPKNKNYSYVIEDTAVAELKNGLINPIQPGETAVQITDQEGNVVRKVPLTVEPAQENQYDQLLQIWNGIIVGNEFYNPENQTMSNQNAQLDAAVDKILADYEANANEGYLWPDVTDYKLSPSLTASYRKLETVAKQVMQPSSKHYQSEPAIRMVKEAMEWLHDHVYNVNSSIVGNWWDYEIGTPRAINNTLSLMKPYFLKEEILQYSDAIEKFVPDPYYFRSTLTPFKALGGNLIDMGRVKIIEGALREDEGIVKEAIQSLSQAFQFTDSGEGFYRDGSYIDHTNVAYTGAYGNVMIDGLSQLLPVVLETGYLDQSNLDVLYQIIDRAFIPMMYKGEMMELTRGRSISRQQQESHVAGGEVIHGIMRIAESSELAVRERLNAVVKTWVLQDNYYDVFRSLSSYRDIHLMQNLLKDDAIATVERTTSLHLYQNMDKVVYHNAEKDFALGISMYSDTTQNFEYMNGENARGWHTADGAVYLYNADLSHYSDNYWPTINAQFLPGTTVVLEEREDGSGQTTLPSAFVGGAQLDERTASVAMDFTKWNQTLTAKKSWFILGDKVAFLGAGIQNSSEFPAVTTIENRKLKKSEEYELFVDGQKVQLNEGEVLSQKAKSALISNPHDSHMNIGYVFLGGKELSFKREMRSGAWKEINTGQSETTYQNEFLSVYQEHEEQGDTYAYALYPNVTLNELKPLSNGSRIDILQNDEHVQAVYDKDLKQWGIVLYEDQEFKVDNYFTLKQKGIYAIRRDRDRYTLSYHNPEEESASNLSIDAPKGYDTVKEPSSENGSRLLEIYRPNKK